MNNVPSSTFDSLCVDPYIQLLSPTVLDLVGGPQWPDFNQRVFERHCRFGRPIDRDLEAQSQPDDVPLLNGPHLWLGPVVGHYGHQTVEFSHRILQSVQFDRNASLLFATRAVRADSISQVNSHWRYPNVSVLPAFVKALLGWFEVDFSKVRVVDTAIRVERLSVFAQGEQLGVRPSSWYLDLLDDFLERKPKSKRAVDAVYVSRAGMRFGKIAGESYLEKAFTSCGVQVIRPETMSLQQQTEVYRSAGTIIFSEGSAIHTLGLLGRGLGSVVVLQRRPDFKHVWQAEAVDRAESYWAIDSIEEVFPSAQSSTAITCLDPQSLLEEFSSLGFQLRSSFSIQDFNESVLYDLKQFRLDLADRRFGLGVERRSIAHEQTRILEYEMMISGGKSESLNSDQEGN